MRPKKKVDRRRAKVKDSDGNMVKVKLDKRGDVKKAKYAVGQPSGKKRMDAISEMGNLVKDVKKRRDQVATNKLRKKLDRLENRYDRGMDPGKYLDKVDKKSGRALKKVKR